MFLEPVDCGSCVYFKQNVQSHLPMIEGSVNNIQKQSADFMDNGKRADQSEIKHKILFIN